MRQGATLQRSELGPLLRFGGWMTVTAVIGPVMVYADRFVIGALQSMTMVAYYTTPYDLTQRLSVLSQPVVAVLFPAFSASAGASPGRLAGLFRIGLTALLVGLFAATLLVVAFAREGLALWLGSDFAVHSARVLQWLAAAAFVNGMAQLALSLVQSAGRPDLGARLHAIELPLYAVVLVAAVRWFGIMGAAVAWFARVAVDAAVLFLMARRMTGAGRAGLRRISGFTAAALGALAIAAVLPGTPVRAAYAGAVLLTLVVLTRAWITRLARDLGEGARAATDT